MSEKYSKLTAELKNAELIVINHRERHNSSDAVTINIDDIELGSPVFVGIKSKSFHYANRILLNENIAGTDSTLVVYTDNGNVYAYKHNDPSRHPLSRLLIVRSKVFSIWLSRASMRLAYVACIINKYGLPIETVHLAIGDNIIRQKNVPVFADGINLKRLLRQGIFFDQISMKPLLEGEPPINSSIGFMIRLDDSDGRVTSHSLTKGTKRYANQTKWYYAPITQTRRNGFSVSIRRNSHGGLSIVRRRLEAVENTPRFRLYESLPVSFLMYYLAHIVRKLSRIKVNLYFEKLAGQAEEGAIELFRKARDESGASKNYFIIRDTAPVYKSIRYEKDIVRNFTLRSYWLMYRANNIIATEVPQHMNILRSGNKYTRRAPYTQTFVFLQHGITYLKPQDKTTSFKKGREGEPDYMVVNSRKERDITSDMLHIEEERLLCTGMPIFDGIRYNHITADSPDIVTIMLTWKPYEEHMENFTESTYYKTTIQLYESLIRLIDKENIRIIAHPKFKEHMLKTDIESALWHESVASALEQTKMIITDYSSVCYNVFYQGGGVIFYQPDLDRYQEATGRLIPGNDEYIGARIFHQRDMDELLHNTLGGGAVNLSSLRSEKFIHNYNKINEYRDGNNIQRIYRALQELEIV